MCLGTLSITVRCNRLLCECHHREHMSALSLSLFFGMPPCRTYPTRNEADQTPNNSGELVAEKPYPKAGVIDNSDTKGDKKERCCRAREFLRRRSHHERAFQAGGCEPTQRRSDDAGCASVDCPVPQSRCAHGQSQQDVDKDQHSSTSPQAAVLTPA